MGNRMIRRVTIRWDCPLISGRRWAPARDGLAELTGQLEGLLERSLTDGESPHVRECFKS